LPAAPAKKLAYSSRILSLKVECNRPTGQEWGLSVSNSGVLIVREDTAIKGEVRNCRQLEVYGYIEGDITAAHVLVHQGGRCYGKVKSENADVHGDLQGEVTVKHLINIRSSGSVSGNVRYGKLALEQGGNLSAEVRNVPPTLGGDLDLSVSRGKAVRITPQDLTAYDPDDTAQNLTFTISNARNGFITLAGGRSPVTRFTQADLTSGKVSFTHDGTNTQAASFEVVVADRSGATSGAPQTVKVHVTA
jgi:cytoskeletal protein CcmA (bactofilin family)